VPVIVVTGATGTIGAELLRLLAERGLELKALSRKPPSDEPRPGIAWVAGDLSDRESLPGIFAGAERLFLLTGNVGDMVRLEKNAIAAAEEAGVAHVVKLSALGASDHSKSVIGLWHYNVERTLRATDLTWTILRPHVFMQNLLDQRDTIRGEAMFYSPSGEARIPMVDTRDIAAVAAAALTEPGHEGKRYTLTGPEALSYREAAAVLSDVLGRTLTYVPETDDDAWSRLRGRGLPPWHIAAQLALAGYQRQGGGTDIITDTIEAVTGRPPCSFRDFARDHAPAFR
jgi:uncharacterized protein YbjT (DUF2867 family)